MSLRLPLLTLETQRALEAARAGGVARLELSLDLGCSQETVEVDASAWRRGDVVYPHIDECRERTVYHWTGNGFEPVARWSGRLVKLVPTEWRAPTDDPARRSVARPQKSVKANLEPVFPASLGRLRTRRGRCT